jgi:exosortase K
VVITLGKLRIPKDINLSSILHYIVLGILTLIIFIWLNQLSNEQVRPLLDFYKNTVEIFFGNTHYYSEADGHYYGGYYTIGRECLGLNITAFCFAVCGLANIDRLKGWRRCAWLAVSAAIAVAAGVTANVLRLLSSIYFVTFANFETIHALLGIVIYLTFAVVCYAFSRRASVK